MPGDVAFVHIKIVHPDPEAAAQYMIDVFGGTRVEQEIAARIESHVPGIGLAHVLVGGTVFQFVKPNENLESWKKQLDSNGPGIHNISLTVADIEGTCAAIQDRGGETVLSGDFDMQDLLGYQGDRTFKATVIDARAQVGMRWELWKMRAGWLGGGQTA